MNQVGRIYCTVPSCGRYTKTETAIKLWGSTNVRFICGRHWRRLTRCEKRVWYRIERLQRRFGSGAVPNDRKGRVFDALIRRSAEPA